MRADLSKVNLVGVLGAFTLMLVVLAAALLLARPALERGMAVDGPSFTSLFQGVLRWNTYVALAAVGGLYGASGITVAAVALVCLVPIVNVICVVVLSRYGGTGSTSLVLMARQLGRNPLIWSCAAGMAINVLKVPVPAVILEFGDVLGRASLAIGLLVVGGGLVLRDLARPRLITYMTVALTLVVKPLITLAAGAALGLSGLELTVIVLLAAVPSAPAGYVLARQMGGNAPASGGDADGADRVCRLHHAGHHADCHAGGGRLKAASPPATADMKRAARGRPCLIRSARRPIAGATRVGGEPALAGGRRGRHIDRLRGRLVIDGGRRRRGPAHNRPAAAGCWRRRQWRPRPGCRARCPRPHGGAVIVVVVVVVVIATAIPAAGRRRRRRAGRPPAGAPAAGKGGGRPPKGSAGPQRPRPQPSC